MKTIHLTIYGIVQGVFFRSGAKQEADLLKIKGWIKNTFEGTVECVAQGEEGALEKFVQWCKKGPTAAVVKKIDIKHSQETELFSSFEVIR